MPSQAFLHRHPLWRTALQESTLSSATAMWLVALFVPVFWFPSKAEGPSYSLGVLLAISLPLAVGGVCGAALSSLQRTTHQTLWPGFRAAVRRDALLLMPVTAVTAAVGAALFGGVPPVGAFGFALFIHALGLIPYPNLLMQWPSLIYVLTLAFNPPLQPLFFTPEMALVHTLLAGLVAFVCVSSGTFERVRRAPQSLLVDPSSLEATSLAVETLRARWGGAGSRPMDIGTGRGRWRRAARLERFGTAGVPWKAAFLAITVPLLVTLAVSALLPYLASLVSSAEGSVDGATALHTIAASLVEVEGLEDETSLEAMALGVALFVFSTSFLAPFTRDVLYPASRNRRWRALAGESLQLQGLFLVFGVGAWMLVGHGLAAALDLEVAGLWGIEPRLLALILTVMPMALALGASLGHRSHPERCGTSDGAWKPLLAFFGLFLATALLISKLPDTTEQLIASRAWMLLPLPWLTAQAMYLYYLRRLHVASRKT